MYLDVNLYISLLHSIYTDIYKNISQCCVYILKWKQTNLHHELQTIRVIKRDHHIDSLILIRIYIYVNMYLYVDLFSFLKIIYGNVMGGFKSNLPPQKIFLD